VVLRRLRIENLVLIREADLELSEGLNAITGETGAGKTILAQAVGLLLGSKGDAKAIGPAGKEAYVEAEFDLPEGFFEEDGLETLAELRPEDEAGLVLARRIFPDGRTRAYAWGRAAAREDLAAATELLVGMSGQFEQRRLARPAYQLEVLDSFVGDEQMRRRASFGAAWREFAAAKRRHDEIAADSVAAEARLAELEALVEDTKGLEPGTEASLLAERERLRHLTELAEGSAAAAEALSPEDGEGAAVLAAKAERSIAPLERLAPELAAAATELRDLQVRLADVGAELRGFLDSLEAEPDRLEHVEAGLERISDARRRFRCDSYEELLERATAARAELDAREAGSDPAAEAAAALAEARGRVDALAAELHEARAAATDRFAAAVAAELRGIGLGEGEFHVELHERELGSTGRDTVTFLIRPNPGLPFAPVAETASGGELSRIALALAAAAGDKATGRAGGAGTSSNGAAQSAPRMTLVFDEIDAGIGGQTAHAVAQTLRRLGERSQVVTITHLPQIASVADRHLRVEKVPGDPTHTRIEQLAESERRDELQRMLGGREFLSTVR
jgi:DNA repair protein RecN (Recombination protein N)